MQTFANPAYVALIGYDSQDELAGMNILNLIAYAERVRIAEYIEHHLIEPSLPFECETIGLKKDGNTFNMDVKLSLFN